MVLRSFGENLAPSYTNPRKRWQRFRIVMSCMARRTVSMAKTSTVNHSAAAAPIDLSVYCRDLDEWPRSWMGFEKDLPPGERMVAYFRPFLEHLVRLELSRKTIHKLSLIHISEPTRR